jgi:hypothetical protein
MKRVWKALIGVTLVLAVAVPALCQSLDAVSKKEAARRKAIKTPSKVYTNDDLRGATSGSSIPAPAGSSAQPQPAVPPTAAAQEPAARKDPKVDDPTKTEAYWRGRITEAQQGLTRAQIFQEALQSRINALSTDFVNRDDPVQRSRIAADRQKALAELDRVRQEIQQYQKAIVDIQEEARRAGVPPGWLR